jgi:uncharacterized protein (TIGR02598 family)
MSKRPFICAECLILKGKPVGFWAKWHPSRHWKAHRFFIFNFVQFLVEQSFTMCKHSIVNSPCKASNKENRTRAFSLVEVAMSLGIVAFAFTALMGMLPIGLTLFRNAADTSVTTRIVQKVSGDLQQADFDTIQIAEDEILFFDEHGTSLPSSDGAIYWARVNVFPDAELPGSAGAGTSDLARVVIQVVHNPGAVQPSSGADGTWSESSGTRLIMRSLFVARNTPQA